MTAPQRPPIWLAYAAGAWALAFGAVSFVWAAGAQVGAATLGVRIEQLAAARDPGFVALLWATGALKVLIGPLVLALLRSWGTRSRRALLLAVWSVGALLTLYGGEPRPARSHGDRHHLHPPLGWALRRFPSRRSRRTGAA